MNKTPADFVPSFSVFASETAQRTLFAGLGTLQAAVQAAESLGMRTFVIRRSRWTVMGENFLGMVVHTKRG